MLEPLEDRRLLDSSLADVESVQIATGTDFSTSENLLYNLVDAQATLAQPGLVNSISLFTPQNTEYDLSDPSVEGGSETWFLDINSTNQSDVEDFTQGMYFFRFNFSDGHSEDMQVFFGDWDTMQPTLEKPVQAPNLTNPAHGSSGVDTQTTFTWFPVSDNNVNIIHLLVIDDTTDTDIVSEFIDPSQSSFGPVNLIENHDFSTSLTFANAQQGKDPLGGTDIDVLIGLVTAVDTNFTTSPAEQPLPDLVGEMGNSNIPDIVVPGDKLRIPVIVRNTGDAAAQGALRITLYASTDQTFDVDDVQMATIAKPKVKLAPGKSKKFKMKFTVPDNLDAGDYYAIAVIDADNTIAESNENNNTAATDDPTPLAWRFGNFSGRRNVKLSVMDSDHTKVTLMMKGEGYGDLTFDAELILSEPIPDLTLTNTGTKSVLVVKTDRGGDGEVTVGNITADNSMRGIAAKTTNLTGDLNITNGVQKVQFNNIRGSNITIGQFPQAKAAANLKFGEVRDSSMVSAMPIKSLLVNAWANRDETPDLIIAPRIDKLTSKDDFESNLELDDPEAAFSIKKLTVLGALVNMVLNASSNIGSVSVVGMANSGIYAGLSVGFTGLPVSTEDFTSQLSIKKVTIHQPEKGDSFVNSFVAASSIGKITLGTVDSDNMGTPFGFATTSIKTYKHTEQGGTVGLRRLTTPGEYDENGDYLVRILDTA